MMAEINELRRQIEEKEAINQNLQASKITIESGIDELKTALDDETQSKAALSRELQEQRHDSDMLRQKMEVEQATKADLMRRLTKCNNDVVVWKNKYETDSVQRIEELEDARNRLNLRLAECEEQVEQATAHFNSGKLTFTNISQGDQDHFRSISHFDVSERSVQNLRTSVKHAREKWE